MKPLNLTRAAHAFLNNLQAKQYKQVASKIWSLSSNPRPQDYKHLSGHPKVLRVDVGEYRICYKPTEASIEVILVGTRNDDAVYRELDRIDG